ncbi:MAG TPA: LysR substrate-binding domain-containing protein [Burkholderiaceae bacterium]
MEIKWIEDFVALAQYQSFSRAAEERNVSQSGFSRRIQALEQWVGADLIDRSTYPPSLTAAGRLFKEAAEEVLLKLYDARAVIREDRRLPGPGLQIAAGHTIALNFLSQWLVELPAQFHEVRTRVVPTNVHDSIVMLANANCDLMFAYHHPSLPLHLDPSKYEHLSLGHDALLPVCRAADGGGPLFRLSAGAQARPAPLLGYSEGSYFGRCLEFLLRQARSAPALQRHYESDMAELLKKMALAGEGVAWLPHSAIAGELARGELIAAGGGDWRMELEIRVYRDATQRNPLVATLWKALQDRRAGRTA